ncbi:MAG: hypothetical protein JST54_34360 [Deltaproteobacteria bacterium]|nr:hypothetical protein [Deltaproteobacteria bacterium]
MPVDAWPELPLDAWKDTEQLLHRCMQIPGKLCLALAAQRNHFWQVAYHLTARGLTSTPLPYGDGTFEIRFDLVDHGVHVETSSGARRSMPLVTRSVAAFHAELMAVLGALGIEVHIWNMPVEMADPIPFDEDHAVRTYDAEMANRFFRVLLQADQALKAFASQFVGKQSPTHFFWGSFDLAQTRFSGRRAPPRPGADRLTRESYSHEEISVGFWPGTEGVCDASFYAYAAPEPAGFRTAAVHPAAAYYSERLGEYVMPYEAVRRAAHPRERIVEFCQSVYEAGASLGGWDRAALERAPVLGATTIEDVHVST